MEEVKSVATQENLETAQVYINFVKTNLEPLAQHLNVAVEWLWNILVMQARVEAIVYLVVSASMLITSAIIMRIFFKSLGKARFAKGYGGVITVYKHKETGEEINSLYDDWDNADKYASVKIDNVTDRNGYVSYFTGIASALLLLIGIITSASSLSIIVTGLINPEFRAIEKIVEFAKPQVERSSGESK